MLSSLPRMRGVTERLTRFMADKILRRNQGIEVIRVLHGARDIQSLFEEEDDD